MHSWLVRRATLVSELRLAHEESARLGDMIPILRATHLLDGIRLNELVFERRRAFHRALALHKALRKMDAEALQAADGEAAAQTQPAAGDIGKAA